VIAPTAPASPTGADPFRHPALFYRGIDEYLAGTMPFVQEALAVGDPVAVAVPGERLAWVREALSGTAAHVRLLDMAEEGRNPGRILPGVLLAFAQEHGAARVWIVGEPVWAGRSDAELPACAEHEALINRAFAGRSAEILCPYDVEALPAVVLADAERTHPVLIGRPRSAPYGPDEVLADCNRPPPEPRGPVPTLVVDAATLPSARALAVAEGERAGLRPDRVDDLVFVVNELVTNSLEHARTTARLRVWAHDRHVVAEVADAGRFDDLLAGRTPPLPEQARGRGLVLVHHLADLVRVHRTERGTTIRAHLRI